jgi:hypothetical protein
MSFKENNYVVIKNIVPKNLCEFLTNYFILKRKCAHTLYSKKFIPQPGNEEWGFFGDTQVDTWSIYGDMSTEVLLDYCTPIMEKELDMKLIPTYSYARVYIKGNDLKKHIDRKACEFSTTVNLGGDSWPIYLDPDIEINLSPGDMLIYKGMDVAHWRNPFEGKFCVQTFLHYNKEGGIANDTRPHIGLPAYTKKNDTDQDK